MVQLRAVAQQALEMIVATGLFPHVRLSLRSYPEPSSRQTSLKNLSLQELRNVELTTASKEPERVWQTPVAIHKLDQDDIRRFGTTTFPDLLRTVPGASAAVCTAA
jgi:hypothetical protein